MPFDSETLLWSVYSIEKWVYGLQKICMVMFIAIFKKQFTFSVFKYLFFQLSWGNWQIGIICVPMYVTWCFDLCILCGVIATIKLINKSIASHTYWFFFSSYHINLHLFFFNFIRIEQQVPITPQRIPLVTMILFSASTLLPI